MRTKTTTISVMMLKMMFLMMLIDDDNDEEEEEKDDDHDAGIMINNKASVSDDLDLKNKIIKLTNNSDLVCSITAVTVIIFNILIQP